MILAGLLLAALPAWTQAGDVPGEEQPPLPEDLVVPPAPVLAPDAARASFVLQPGYAIELVASEPLVSDPVAIAWDPAGRMWVVEMRGFMPDADGTGELAPVGRIAVLSDKDGDGRMDARTTFLDGLVLPRGVLPMRDGALVIAPPDLVFCRDTDGDGKADTREVVDTGFDGPELANPEHAINGLMPTLDNWIRCANHTVRYRLRGGKWERQRTDGGGQWGITQDDVGRVFFNTNSDPLRYDRLPSHYLVRNPNLGRALGSNEQAVTDFSVWPARITPGVNRGYKPGFLAEGKLTVVTAACGPLIHRGDVLRDLNGDAFVCEPAANLVKRYELEVEPDGTVRGRPAYPGSEFLASTDERFRPVNLSDGPDGGLYVVDMYRGVLQHRVYMTTFLRKQVDARGLAAPIGLGRIWRVVPSEKKEKRLRPAFATASWTEIVALLSDPSGWWRDMAQRVLVEEGSDSKDAIELVRAAARTAESALGRMHAVWALEGMAALDEELLGELLSDPDERVVTAGVRASERFLARANSGLLGLRMTIFVRNKRSPALEAQLLLSLGEGACESSDGALATLLKRYASTVELRSAALSGMRGRELAFTQRLLGKFTWSQPEPGERELFELLARCVTRSARSDEIEALLGLAVRAAPWQRRALVAGCLAGRPAGPDGKPSWIRVAQEPTALAKMPVDGAAEREQFQSLIDALAWPGKPGFEEVAVRPLDETERALFARGATLYATTCAACHQASGDGEEGKAPRLRGSDYVLGAKPRAIKILLHGLEGPLEIDDRTWNLEMPAYSAPDADIAAVLTYVRREWGHGVDPVSPEEVAAVRATPRKRPWTAAELADGQ